MEGDPGEDVDDVPGNPGDTLVTVGLGPVDPQGHCLSLSDPIPLSSTLKGFPTDD